MKDWFDNLAAHEQAMVLTGAGVALVIVVWALVWAPLKDSTAELRENVAERAQLLADLRRAQNLAESAGGQAAASTGQSLLLIVDSSARTFGLAESFTQTRPNGPDEISVSFQRARFDSVVAWLVELEKNFGVSAGTVSINEAGQPGLVSGQIFLSRG